MLEAAEKEQKSGERKGTSRSMSVRLSCDDHRVVRFLQVQLDVGVCDEDVVAEGYQH